VDPRVKPAEGEIFEGDRTRLDSALIFIVAIKNEDVIIDRLEAV
jgi:hypothetical protein